MELPTTRCSCVFARQRKFLSGFDFWPYLKGATRIEGGLSLPVQAVQETAEQYAKSRTQHRKVRLRWRCSDGARRSLGWIPFKVRTIRYAHGQVYFAGRWLSIWDSWGLGNYEIRAGSFSEDARGRWYLNVTVQVKLLSRQAPVHADAIGIDLGLKDLAALSDGTTLPAQRFYASHDRDINAALNIRARGIAWLEQQFAAAWEAKAGEAAVNETGGLHLHDRSVGVGHGPLAAGIPVP
jgi:hypothetical protein